jgi:hypothetical protein
VEHADEAEALRRRVEELEQALRAREELKQGERLLCVICLEQPATMAAIPCGHRCLCEADARAINSMGKKRECPLCRKGIKRMQRVYDA